MKPFQNIGAYVLAGGKSSRMGQDKGLMLLLGKPLAGYVTDALKPCFEHIALVTDNPAYGAFGYTVIPDEQKNLGPAGGIYTALRHSTFGHNLVVSCDMPFITPQLVQWLAEEAMQSDAEITLPKTEKGYEPLFAVYSQAVLPQLAQMLAGGMVKLQHIVSCFNHKTLPAPPAPALENLNTLQNFETAQQYLLQQMSITILAFGQTAEATGSPQFTLSEPVQDTNHLKSLLEQRFPALADMQYALALNTRLITQNTPITPPATVALLPPFSGG